MYSVIMAGGSGTRFWPASRKGRPKQLLTLTGQRSLLQQTVDRLAPLTPADKVLVVTGRDHADQVAKQLPKLPPANILAEPMGRNTAAAAGLAAAFVAKIDPKAVCLVLPADHLITDEALFINTLRRAAQTAQNEDVLVTLGLTPRYAATGFGYIETGEILERDDPQICEVKAFQEKPNLKTAQKYQESGRHFWNSGMFAWRAEVLLQAINTHLPELAQGLSELSPYLGAPGQDEALARVYPGLPSISLDYGIMEKSHNLRVIKADFGWSDVGSWEAMADLWQADECDNCCQDGKILAIEAQGNLAATGGRLTAFLGVNHLAVVVTDDVVLVMPKDRAQDVRQVIDMLKSQNLHDYL